MERWLDIGTALLAITAAVFWFLSAYGELAPMIGYWEQTPASDPFYQTVKFSAAMNQWAAGFSGASALSMAARLFIITS
jgi:hypothetical protein